MKVLVTGASGFIGRNLLLRLPRDWETMATYNGSPDFLRFLSHHNLDLVQPIRVDLRVSSEVKKQLARLAPLDAVIHLAGNTDVTLSAGDDMLANTFSLVNVLQAVRTGLFVFMSSGAVYDGNIGVVSPSSPTRPRFPYAINKLASEHYVLGSVASGRVDSYVILRFFGAYGPFEPARKITTRLVESILFETRNQFEVRGDGQNLIDIMFVDDAVNGILSVLKSERRDLIVDFCSGKPLTIDRFICEIARILGKTDLQLIHRERPVEYIQFRASEEAMKKLFDFIPQESLREGMSSLVKWLQARRAGLAA